MSGYATASQVCSLAKARVIGQGNNPTLDDVKGYITMIAADIDAILVNKGYQVPVDPSYLEAYGYLAAINSKGAVMLLEESSPTSVNVDKWRKDYDESLMRLRKAEQVMDAPQDKQRANARGPGITVFPTGNTYDPMLDSIDGTANSDPTNNRSSPFFSRSQRF